MIWLDLVSISHFMTALRSSPGLFFEGIFSFGICEPHIDCSTDRMMLAPDTSS